MLQTIRAQIGDRIEFSLDSDGAPASTIEGRIMDVDSLNPLKCTIQVSPFEPLQQLDLSQVGYKIVYAIGDLTKLKPEMIGWQVEILLDGRDTTVTRECGTIKQVDCELNCALIAFDDGHKDWRDLTMNSFKVVARSPKTSSPTKATSVESQLAAIANIPRLQTELSLAVHANPLALPSLEAHEFDWYVEGAHVELCDREGNFHEGALLCSLRDKTLQLYNEKRQFFEIQMVKQSFKVIIHGLMTLKSVPLGQAVEIYSPMHAEFRRGLILKAAEMGRLTPVRFEDVGLEWLDLTSQTFKLVFAASDTPAKIVNHSVDPVESISHIIHSNKDGELESSRRHPEPTPTPSTHDDTREDQPPANIQPPPESPEQKHGHERTKQHSHKPTHHVLPTLAVGQAVELWEVSTRQFVKYRVTHVHTQHRPNTYDLELALGSNSGSNLTMSVARMADADQQVTIDLATVKARIQLSCDEWERFEPILRGYRVDVYDKVDRSVLNGKIIESSCSDDYVNGPRVHVKLKDGSKRWFDVKHTKIKLKLSGETGAGKTEQAVMETTSPMGSDSMWHRVEPPSVEENSTTTSLEDRKTSILARQHSEKLHQEAEQSTRLARHASTPSIANTSPPKGRPSPSRVPSLDLSGLVRERAEAVAQVPATSESTKADVSDESQRSTYSNGEALSDLLPTMDDLWLEEPTVVGEDVVLRYVHVGTGEVTHEMPQWLKRVDGATGESFIMNSTTGVRFQPPGSSTSATTSPQPSDRSPVVVTLPIGPLEAARVASQMNAASASVDLCAEAFGS